MLNVPLEEALGPILQGMPLPEFCEWFAQANATAEPALSGLLQGPPGEARRLSLALARQLWGLMPVPFNRWRARGLPRTERNSPCHCGSGRKYKHCCADYEKRPLNFDAESLLVMCLGQAGQQGLDGALLRQAPALALGHAALQWNEEGRGDITVSVLQPLFASAASLDERHEVALDALLDALLAHSRLVQRKELLERMAQHPDRALATTGFARLASMYADRGDYALARQYFEQARHKDAGSPQLWHLELTLLHCEGREEEARLRAPLLAAQARRAGLDELAEVLIQLGTQGMRNFMAGVQAGEPGEIEQQWLDLLESLPATLDAAALASLYMVTRSERLPDGTSGPMVRIKPTAALAKIERRWDRLAAVEKPVLTSLQADVSFLLDDLHGAGNFLREEPLAWFSAHVLDDLLLAALELLNESGTAGLLKGARRLAAHALGLLKALAGPAQCHWVELSHRPLLRCLAIAVELAVKDGDEALACALMEQGLALNPNDNFGWRSELAPLLLERNEAAQALALLGRYPDDMPPAWHLQALALFMLDRHEEAQAVLRQAHEEYPLFLKTLLPDVMDPPAIGEGPGMLLGGEEAAWYFRLSTRPIWLRTGALAWARALGLPEPKPKMARAARPAPGARRKSLPTPGYEAGVLSSPLKPRHEKRLRKTCSRFVRLQGYLQALAWSPQLSAPGVWVHKAIDMQDRMPNSRTQETAMKALNEVLEAVMAYYNHYNAQVFNAMDTSDSPLADVSALTAAEDADVWDWAAGFMQGCELAQAGWARAGHKVGGVTGPMGILAGLAARAPLTAGAPPVLTEAGRPHLQSLAIDSPVPAQAQLRGALSELWPVVARWRQAQKQS